MTSEREKCGLTSFLPISCRDRAEAFARSLQSRLNSLGSQNSTTDERSWLGSHETSIALSQPLHNPDAERYLALEILESPCSPQDEVEESELHRLLIKDNLREKTNGDCHCPKLGSSEGKCNGKTNGLVRHYSGDSDSEVFYDLDDDPPSQPYINGLKESESSKSLSETGIDLNSQGTSSSNPSDTFATSLDCTPQSSESEDMSTLSLKDDSQITGNSRCEDCEKNREETVNGVVEKFETDLSNSEHDEGYVNGEYNGGTDEPDIYISNLTIPSELIVECCAVVSEEVKVGSLDEVDSSRLYENGTMHDIDDDDDNDVIPRVRRCSSLKTGKTPPGTPGRKKIVRFADVLGLDLADVRTFLDEIPKIPKSAYDDLSDADADLSDASELTPLSNGIKFHGIKTERILVPLFEQPAGLPNFLDLVRDNLVCLENALVDDPILFLIKGTVRVRNLDFHKSVHIRYTLDSWRTYADVQAAYASNSCDGFSDRFTFTIYAHTLTMGQKLEFACRFQCKGCQYWDSNGGNNYSFQCLPAASNNTAAPVLPTVRHDDFIASFY